MPNKNIEISNNESLSSIRLYETFVAKGFSKEEAKEVISDFVDLTKRTGQSIESKFDAKLDLILTEIKLNTVRIEALEGKFKIGIGLNIAVFTTLLAAILAFILK